MTQNWGIRVQKTWKNWLRKQIEDFGLMRIDVSGKILKYVRQRFFHSATFAPFFGVGDQILHEHAFAGENS